MNEKEKTLDSKQLLAASAEPHWPSNGCMAKEMAASAKENGCFGHEIGSSNTYLQSERKQLSLIYSRVCCLAHKQHAEYISEPRLRKRKNAFASKAIFSFEEMT